MPLKMLNFIHILIVCFIHFRTDMILFILVKLSFKTKKTLKTSQEYETISVMVAAAGLLYSRPWVDNATATDHQ